MPPLGADAGGLGQASGGQREMVPVLARAAVAVGIPVCSSSAIQIPTKPCRTVLTLGL